MDLEESFEVGKNAVLFAKERKDGNMVAIKRKNTENYEVEYICVPLEKVSNRVKKMPLDFISKDGVDVTKKAISYLKPLILGQTNLSFYKGTPEFFNLV